MDKEELKELLDRYRDGTCTAEEAQKIEKLYLDLSEGKLLPDMQEILSIHYRTWQALHREEIASRLPRLTYKRTIAVAAAILGFVIVSSVAYYTFVHTRPVTSPQYLVQDIPPGSNKATLTLSTGQQIVLDNTKDGDIAQVPGVTIKKTKEGKLIYTVSKNSNNTVSPNQVNTVTTPKGGQYEIVLEDGTKVWLNAASKITFPASFNGLKERPVVLTGEAYFEVTKNPRKPFSVRSTEQLVTVTGTHFNVSCYPDEKTQTTLAQGSVVVFHPATRKKLFMKPGEQTTINHLNGIKVQEVNPEDAFAWKDGLFEFVQTPLHQVLAQIGRWYNVEVDYTGIPNEDFEGEISRKISLSQVFELLEASSNVKFKMEGRRIMVN